MTTPLPFDPIAEAQRHWREHGWPEAADGMAVVTAIMRAHQLVLAAVDGVLRPLGLTFARYEVLMLLRFSSHGALPLSVIGSRLQVHPTSVTSAIDRLERDGLVTREPHPTDRRTTLARLSPAGRRLASRATDRLNAGVFTALPLTPGEQKSLIESVRALRLAAGDFTD